MMAPLYIRADAGPAMGTGHVMRCLALAREWQRLGGEVLFLSRIDVPALRERIVAEGFRLVSPDDLASENGEASSVAAWLAAQGGKGWLALDGYHFGTDYQRRLRASGQRVLVIDDDALLPEYCCDLLLNQNLHARELAYPDAAAATLLLGPRYALLRREFRGGHGEKEPQPAVARKILLTMGGSDPANATPAILAALAESGMDGLEVVALAGPANPHREHLAALAATLPFRCEVREAAAEMAPLMRWADAAIAAAGTTSYELAAMGLPFLAVVVADNQRRNAAGLAAHGIAGVLGEWGMIAPNELAVGIASFLRDQGQRQAQAVAGRQLVDGLGASRVVTAMLARDVRLRPVCPQDEELLLRWANDPETRANSFCGEAIAPAEHARWLATKLAAEECVMYLAEDATGTPCGVARFEMVQGRGVISVGIAPEFRRQGLGSRIIRAACERVFAERALREIEALVKVENLGSLTAFSKAGFQVGSATARNGMPAMSLHCEPEARHG
ncbi:MAG: UDP-2,4-diacetamido-2,4,6-trideoxy-beta-L-altropyranose hydrolase [Thermodesulfobacteriota bacterium]